MVKRRSKGAALPAVRARVTEKEVREVLHRPGQEFPGGEDSRIRLGQTVAGRYLQNRLRSRS